MGPQFFQQKEPFLGEDLGWSAFDSNLDCLASSGAMVSC